LKTKYENTFLAFEGSQMHEKTFLAVQLAILLRFTRKQEWANS